MLVASLALLVLAMIPNGTFEKVKDGVPEGWRVQRWNGSGACSVVTPGRNGGSAVLIESDTGFDASYTTTIEVKPFSTYRVSAWIKTENMTPTTGAGALLNLHERPDHTRPLTGTNDWTQVSMEVETGADDALVLNCLVGYHGLATGRAWFDDVEVELVREGSFEPKATIVGSKRGEPISKYIYSQFIEHLGRCIYGGIWAEMLEDRKFLDTPGAGPSPWKAEGGLRMLTAEPFVGKHTPEVTGDLVQDGLWFEKGREYEGYVWLRGGKAKVAIGSHAFEADSGSEWKKIAFRFASSITTQDGEFRFTTDGPVEIGPASLMPADNVRGMRADTLALLRRLDAPLYRWPGGNFVSGYEWRDGIGDRDRRAPRRNPAWMGIEHNDFGTHEFLDFCAELETEPLIVVNTGFGDAWSAGQWVEYVNGDADTEMGRWRAKNGRREPWDVRWWGIGNEMFGSWQLGYMALDQYWKKHNLVYDRMTEIDPDIITIGVGEVGGNWSRGMLTHSANHMDLISEHFYCGERPGVLSHVRQVPNAIRAKVEAHRAMRAELPSLQGKDIRIAMDEWNYWYGPHVFGELGTRYFVKDGLGIAAGLHEFFRSTDIVSMAQYAQTVNVIGAIKTTPTDAEMETTGLVLELYRREFGTIPLTVEGAPEPLDVSAALTEDGKVLTLGVVNPLGESVTLPLTWQGLTVAKEALGWQIAHPDPMAFNDPGKPPAIMIQETRFGGLQQAVTVPAYSISVIRIPLGSS